MPIIEERPILEELELTPATPQSRRQEIRSGIKAWAQTAAITSCLFFLVTAFVAQGFAVSGSCMEPNLWTGERILGNKLTYLVEPPMRGDVVVFRYPVDPRKTYIKRVIGLPGETIDIRSGRVYINSKLLNEPYVINTAHGDYGPETIKPGKLFVMGDYRDESNDSRIWGELPIANIKAKAWVRYWPVKRLEMMR
jgi:signal peptidase I